jgi:hypothetical protein
MMGAVGSLREINLIKVEDLLFDEIQLIKDTIDFRYMVKTVVPRMFALLKDHDLLGKDSDGTPHMGSSYVVVFRDHVYEIGSYGSVVEIDDYTAIGSGADIAMGSLNTTSNMEAVDRIKKAIEASCKTNLYVNYPIIVTSIQQPDMTIIPSNE